MLFWTDVDHDHDDHVPQMMNPTAFASLLVLRAASQQRVRADGHLLQAIH